MKRNKNITKGEKAKFMRFTLSQSDKRNLDAALRKEKKSHLENRVELKEDVLEMTDTLTEQIQLHECHEIATTIITVLLEVLIVLFDSHPKWFTTPGKQKRVIERVDNMKDIFVKFAAAWSDKGRETAIWKEVVKRAVPEEFRDLIVDKLSIASAITGLVAWIMKMHPLASVFDFILFIAVGAVLGVYILLYYANKGCFLIRVFKKALACMELKIQDFLAIKAYFIILDCEEYLDAKFHQGIEQKPRRKKSRKKSKRRETTRRHHKKHKKHKR